MQGVQAFVLFCDSVRDEVANTQTIVGALPDNLNVPGIPRGLPRLTLYVRIMVDVDRPPEPMTLSLIFQDGQRREIQVFGSDIVAESCAGAKAIGMPYAGILSNVTFPNFPVLMYGRLTAVLQVGGEEIVCGMITFVEAPSSSAQGQLSSISFPVPPDLTPPPEPSRP